MIKYDPSSYLEVSERKMGWGMKEGSETKEEP